MKLSLYLLLFSLVSGSYGAYDDEQSNLETSSSSSDERDFRNYYTSSHDLVTSSTAEPTSVSTDDDTSSTAISEPTSVSTDDDEASSTISSSSSSPEANFFDWTTTTSDSATPSSTYSDEETTTSSAPSTTSSDDVYKWTPTTSSLQETDDTTLVPSDTSSETTATTSNTPYEWTPGTSESTYEWIPTTSADAASSETTGEWTPGSSETTYEWIPTTSANAASLETTYEWTPTSIDTTTSSDVSTGQSTSADSSETTYEWIPTASTDADSLETSSDSTTTTSSSDANAFNLDQITSSNSITFSNAGDSSSSSSTFSDDNTATSLSTDTDTQGTTTDSTSLTNNNSAASIQPEVTNFRINTFVSSSDSSSLSTDLSESSSSLLLTSISSSASTEEPDTTQYIDTTLTSDSSSSATNEPISTTSYDYSPIVGRPTPSPVVNSSDDSSSTSLVDTNSNIQTISSYSEQTPSSISYADVTTTPITPEPISESDSSSSVNSYDFITTSSLTSGTVSFDSLTTYPISSFDSAATSNYSGTVEPTPIASSTEYIDTTSSAYTSNEVSSDAFDQSSYSTELVSVPTALSSFMITTDQNTLVSQSTASIETQSFSNTASEQISIPQDSTTFASEQTSVSQDTLFASSIETSVESSPTTSLSSSSLLYTPVPSRISTNVVSESTQKINDSTSASSKNLVSTTSVNYAPISNNQQSNVDSGSTASTTLTTENISSVSNTNISTTETPGSFNIIDTATSVDITGAISTSNSLISQATTASASITSTSSITQTLVSSNWLPTGIIVQSNENSDAGTDSTVSTSDATATLMLPKVILPDTQATGTVSNFDVEYISIGFTKALNFEFVVKNSLSSAQIFEYLPGALTFPFDGLDATDIKVTKLIPYSSSNLNYIITVAEVEFKKELVEKLQALLLDDSSQLYQNGDVSENTLSQLIDPRVPINLVTDSSSASSDGSEILSILQAQSGDSDASDSDSNSSSDAADMNAIAQSMSSLDGSALSANVSTIKSKKAIAGIVVGTVVGVAFYAGAVFAFVLWRRKKNARERALRNLIRIDSSNSSFSSSESNDHTSAYEKFYNEKDYNPNEIGEIKLDVVSDEEKRGSFLQRFSLSSIGNNEDRAKFIPEISAPINVKNTLGW